MTFAIILIFHLTKKIVNKMKFKVISLLNIIIKNYIKVIKTIDKYF
jgi:hypothetical protein